MKKEYDASHLCYDTVSLNSNYETSTNKHGGEQRLDWGPVSSYP